MSENLLIRFRWSSAASMVCVAVGLCGPAAAQDIGAAGGNAGGPSADQGLAVADWMLYPQVFVGAVVNDNVAQSSGTTKTAWGPRVRPSLLANRDTGIHNIQAYGSIDAQLYPTSASNGRLQARAGVSDTYKPSDDLAVNGVLDYTRQLGLNSAFGIGLEPIILSSNTAAMVTSQTFDQYTGALSVLKKFDRFFIQPNASVQSITYENQHVSSVPGHAGLDGSTESAGLRVGYEVIPALNAFVEPSYQQRSYRRSGLNTDGYRVIAGLSSDQIGLFRGEVRGGFQQQSGAAAIGGSVSSGVFGGAVYYTPLEYLNFAVSADQSVGSTGGLSSTSVANYTRSTQYELDANYNLSSYWSAHARVGYADTQYLGGGGRDSTVVGGMSVSYTFWRNVALTAEYQYTRQSSKTPGFSWDQNMLTMGLSYAY